MEALVFLLTTPTIGAPPKVWPLPKALVPVLLPNGLVLPEVDVDVPVAVVVPVAVDVPVVPDVPDESEPVLLGEDDVVPEVDVVPPKEEVFPRGFDVIPGVPPRTLLPAVPAFRMGWPKRPMAFTWASPK